MASVVSGGSPGASPARPPAQRKVIRRRVLGAVVRVVVVTGTLLTVYALAPLGQRPTGEVGLRLLLGLLVVLAVLGWQIRAVTRSAHPTVRGVEAVAVSVPLLVLMFAAAYFSTGHTRPDSFSESLSRFDAVYFAVTVLTTVGFGDIAPKSDVARSLVTSQMVADLVLGGLIAKVLVGAVRRRRDVLDGITTSVVPQ